MSKQKSNNHLLFLILSLGVLFRIVLAINKVFWLDEAFSWSLSRQTIPNLLLASAADNNPPLYYLLLHFWLIPNQSEFFLRLPSVFFGIISIFLIYAITKRLFNQKIAFTSTMVFTLSPLLIYFSAETRMYSLWLMLTLFAFYFFIKILKKATYKDYLLLGFFGLLSLFTQYFSCFFLLTLFVFLFINRRKYPRQFTAFLIIQSISAIFFLPWFLFFLSVPHPPPWHISPVIGIPATFFSFVLGGVGQVTIKTFFSSTTPLFIRLFFFIGALFPLILFLKGLCRKRQPETSLLVYLIILPMLIVSFISFFYPIFSPRSFLFAAPYFYILCAVAIENLSGQTRRLAKSIVFSLLGFIFLVQFFYPPFNPQTIKESAEYIKKASLTNPTVVHTDLLTFFPYLYYFRDQSTQHLIRQSGLAKETTDIIGGTPVTLESITRKNEPFWSVTLTWDGKTSEFKQKKSALSSSFDFRLVKTINDLEIFYYQPRESTFSPSDK